MSSVKRQKEEAASKKSRRRYGGTTQQSSQADWRTIDAVALVELIQAATATGGAVRFGASRDGGAYALGVYGDGPDPYTVYGATQEEMGEHILHLQDVFEAIAAEQ